MFDLAKLRVGSIRYNAPMSQVSLLGFIVFCTVGMFSAIGNLGAGGTQDIVTSDITNAVLYATFAIGGMFSGGVCNYLGPRLTLFIGTLGYALYIGGLWAFQTHGTKWFLILSGAILGACAALLWTAQGTIMMSVPDEKNKGTAFSVFWTIFSMGSLVGGLIVLGLTVNDGKVSTVTTGIYLAFIIIMFTGSATCFGLLPMTKVVRADGTIVTTAKQASVREEISGMVKVLKNWRIIALFPMFWASNYFYAYQGALNSYAFNGRTRALVAVLEGLGAILGAIVIGLVLDKAPFKSRRARGYAGIALVTVVIFVTWGSALAWQLTFTRSSAKLDWDYTDGSRPTQIIVLLMMMYFGDAAFQGLAYWTMGTLSNDPYTLARFAGVYKAVQSAGGAISFAMDSVKTPYLTELLVSALLIIVSIPLVLIVIRSVPDSTAEIEGVVAVEDVPELADTMALPAGHEVHEKFGDSKDQDVYDRVVKV